MFLPTTKPFNAHLVVFQRYLLQRADAIFEQAEVLEAPHDVCATSVELAQALYVNLIARWVEIVEAVNLAKGLGVGARRQLLNLICLLIKVWLVFSLFDVIRFQIIVVCLCGPIGNRFVLNMGVLSDLLLFLFGVVCVPLLSVLCTILTHDLICFEKLF